MIEQLYNYFVMINLKIFTSFKPYFRRFIRFLALPYCFLFLINWKECNISKVQVAKDLLYIFFVLKYFPDNYSACRFWEKDRTEWIYFYGSSYDPYQRHKLRKKVQRKEYEILFEDKEVCQQLCHGVGLPTPDLVEVLDPTEDYLAKIKFLMNNSDFERVIIKPVNGAAGKGIVIAEKIENKIIIKSRNSTISLKDFLLTDRAVVQKIVVQNSIVSTISSNSLSTIRIVTLYTATNEVLILGATMRFGVGNAFIDNWSAGGIAVGVNIDSGLLCKNAFDKLGNEYAKHPETKVVFEKFQIPMWNDILKLAERAQKAFPYYKLLGMDIAASTDSPVLIEINGFPDLVFQEQTSGPLLKNSRVLSEFRNYDLLINSLQRKL